MLRNIDVLYMIPEFTRWLASLDIPRFSFSFLKNLKAPEIGSETDDLDQSKRTGSHSRVNVSRDLERLTKQAEIISEDSTRNKAGRIWVLEFLDGDGLIAERLVKAYDDGFVIQFLAGSLATGPKVQQFTLPFGMDILDRIIWNHLNFLATGEVEKLPTPEQVNSVVVYILTDSERLLSIQRLHSYVASRGIHSSHQTDGLLKAIKFARDLRAELVSHQVKGERKLSQGFSTELMDGLLIGMQANIRVETADGETRTLHLNLASVADLLYGQLPKPGAAEWILDLFERSGIDPDEVQSISSYPDELNLRYSCSQNSSPPQCGEMLVSYLADRFALMFDLAALLIDFVEANTQFDVESHPALVPWAGSGLLPMSASTWQALPIVAALTGQQFHYLLFREPFLGKFSSLRDDKSVPLVKPIADVNETSLRLIISVYLDVVSLKDITWTPLPSWLPNREWHPLLGFLRTRKQMKDRLAELNEEDLRVLKDIDFFEYLASMGYPDLELTKDEYRGVRGLEKAVDIHSLIHLAPGNLQGGHWPFYYPELF